MGIRPGAISSVPGLRWLGADQKRRLVDQPGEDAVPGERCDNLPRFGARQATSSPGRWLLRPFRVPRGGIITRGPATAQRFLRFASIVACCPPIVIPIQGL